MRYYEIDYIFFFNDTATTEIYTLSLHDALPISYVRASRSPSFSPLLSSGFAHPSGSCAPYSINIKEIKRDRKSTRLNSSHLVISYAVFCLKKKKNNCADHRLHRLLRDI